jgi:hypothetical protein
MPSRSKTKTPGKTSSDKEKADDEEDRSDDKTCMFCDNNPLPTSYFLYGIGLAGGTCLDCMIRDYEQCELCCFLKVKNDRILYDPWVNDYHPFKKHKWVPVSLELLDKAQW